jgi:hypothetical protein
MGDAISNLIKDDKWLKLETAIEIIGDMIALYYGQLCEERREGKNLELIRELEGKVHVLVVERRQCYFEERQREMIDKAYNVYGPFLKNLNDFDSKKNE